MRLNPRSTVLAVMLLLAPHVNAQSTGATLFEIYTNGIRQDAAEFVSNPADNHRTSIPNPKRDTGPLDRFQRALDAATKENLAAGGQLQSFYVVNSAPVTANRTKVRVSGAYPACGEADVQVADDVKQYMAALAGLGAGIDGLGAGGVASVITGAIATLVGLANRYQTTATCSNTCVLVPAYLTEKDIRVETTIGYDSSPNTRRDYDPKNWDEWSYVDKVAISSSTVPVPIRPNDVLRTKTERATCDMKMVCSRVRNWSNDREVSLQMSVFFDASSASEQSCTDFTLISKPYREGFAKRAIDQDRLSTYLRQYGDDSVRRAR